MSRTKHETGRALTRTARSEPRAVGSQQSVPRLRNAAFYASAVRALACVLALAGACGEAGGGSDDPVDSDDQTATPARDAGAPPPNVPPSEPGAGMDGSVDPSPPPPSEDDAASMPTPAADASTPVDPPDPEQDAGSPGGGDDPASCTNELLGWATVAGDGVATTRGGGDAAPVRPKTAQELMALAADASPRVIEIEGTFAVPSLQINSNKTLIGIGKNATINGGLRIRGRAEEPVSNVIVRNLRVNGTTTQVDNDAVQVYFAHHVWIDHCEIFDGPDGNLDLTHAVNWITVSWTKFLYTASYKRPSGESSDHRFSSLVGHSDGNASEDEGRIKITFHHNWWADRVIERMPRVRFGQVHVFNNYFSSAGNNYCVRAGHGARLLIEANYFDGVKSPHEFNSAADEMTAHITARDNVYEQVSGDQAVGGLGMPFESPPYDAKLDAANRLEVLVPACAGPR